MKETITQRVELLRQYMSAHGLQAFIIPSSDSHASEYVAPHWESRQWISGFNGSAGTAVVTLSDAALWTDSRYFLAAAEQLANTPFKLMKERQPNTPSIAQWLSSVLPAGSFVGVDGQVFSAHEARSLQAELSPLGLSLQTDFDPFDTIRPDRPAIPENPIFPHPLCYAGESVASKLQRLRNRLSEQHTDTILLSALDEIAWLLNLRGSDVHCNPVFVAYLLICRNETTLYVNPKKLTPKVSDMLIQQGIALMSYEQLPSQLAQLAFDVSILLPPSTNARMEAALNGYRITHAPSPVAEMKAIKNETEQNGFRQAMLRDGVALVRFLRWLKPAVAQGGVTEIGIDRQLAALRAEQQNYVGLSFDTIAAYADHGAIVHYEATPETDRELKSSGLLLLDTGAQYLDGTTDVTRTIALGTPTPEEKHVYTLVLKGHIALSRAVFPAGASGTQLDLAARYAMWQEGYNYGHGTGHGVGSFLNVHEGPHQIRMNWMPAPLNAGVTVTDEPGLYLPGRFGVRIENTLLAVPNKQTEFGDFLSFEPLTLCPIDTTPIDMSMLTTVEKNWLNDYHQTVRNRLLPLLTDADDAQWLIQQTQPI